MQALSIDSAPAVRAAARPYRVIAGAFGPDLNSQLLDYALQNEARFEKTGVGTGYDVDETIRVSRYLTDLGAHRTAIERRMAAWVPGVIANLGLTRFQPTGFEIEMVAHGDGAFYKRHIDLFTGSKRSETDADRMLSVVYYFFREPKNFSGGALRLYPKVGLAREMDDAGVDVPVEQDTAVAFSSWIPHEVLPVSCASRAFRDSRFAINCWALRDRKS